MRKLDLQNILMGLLCSLFLLPACVDDSYDFDSVDLTITIGGENLALPFGNTEEMLLKKFLKVEDSELLDTLSTGEYKLTKEDNIDDTEVSIDPVTIDNPKANVESFIVFREPATPPIAGTVELENTENVDSPGSITLENSDMPYDILAVSQFNVHTRSKEIVISFVPEDSSIEAIDSIDLSELKMVFPDFMYFEKHKELDIINNTVYFKKTDGDKVIEKQIFYPGKDNAPIILTIREFDFRGENGNGEVKVSSNDPENLKSKRSLSIKDEVTLEGTVTAYSIHVDKVEKNITMKPQITIPNLDVSDLVGRVNPDIDVDPSSIEFDDLPDFLQDDAVKMDLTDPRIYFTVDNTTELPINIIANLQSFKNGEITPPMEKLEEEKVIVGDDEDPIEVLPGGTTLVILSKSGTSEYAGDTKYDYMVSRQVDDLNDLIEIIPDSIQIEISAAVADTLKPRHVILDHKYVVGMDYEIDMELAFGINTLIVYKDTMDGWNDDLKDYEIKKMVINAEADNTIPLELKMAGTAIDVDGNPIAAIEVKIEQIIAAGSLKTNSSEDKIVTTPIVMELTATAGSMKEMDGLVLSVYANPNENSTDTPLMNNQFLILREMKAKVPGGITIDLN